MSISIEEVHQVARLSRLYYSDEEAVGLAKDLSSVLEYFDKLSELDTSGVEPMSHAGSGVNVYRRDAALDRVTRDAVLGNAPESDGEHFRVPKVIRKA